MAEEKKDERADPKDGKEPVAARSASGMKKVIPICLGVFLVAAAGFAWMEGLFGPAPAPVAALPQHPEDSTLVQATGAAHSPGEETLAEAAKTPVQNTLAQATSQKDALPHEATVPAGTEQWLQKEKADLAQRQAELEQRSRELEKLKGEIEQLLTRVQETKSERIVMMAKLYDSMEPEAVARQISSMDDRTVVLLLPQMNTRTAAKVMAALDPKRAAQITTKMLALEP